MKETTFPHIDNPAKKDYNKSVQNEPERKFSKEYAYS